MRSFAPTNVFEKAIALAIVSFATACWPVAKADPGYDYYIHLTPENSVIGNYPAQKGPILKIKSGQTVKFDTGGGVGWRNVGMEAAEWLKQNNIPTTPDNIVLKETVDVLDKSQRYTEIRSGHLLVGPVAVEGAMPGDTLEVRILSIVPRIPYGTTTVIPGRGLVRPLLTQRSAPHVTVFDLKRNVGIFESGAEVPLRPFMGVMATLPPDEEGPNRISLPPGNFAGNLDCKELIAGSTLYIPIFHPGALFFTGDAHAAQGDGEIASTALETANTVVLKLIVRKDISLKAPRAETPTHYITFGLDPNLENAMQMAVDQTLELLHEVKGWDVTTALTFASVSVDFRITQIVDGSKGVHAMIPKSVLGNTAQKTYWYKP
jgi:acetamidase/formamidase